MKPGWGVGAVVAVLLSLAAYLFNITDALRTVSLMLLLAGLWTITTALALVEPKDRNFYAGWGIVVAFLSLFAYIPLNYTFGLIVLAVVALIVLSVFVGRTPRVIAQTTSRPQPAGETPAANPS